MDARKVYGWSFVVSFLLSCPMLGNPQKLRNFNFPHDTQSVLVKFNNHVVKAHQTSLVKRLGGKIRYAFKSSQSVSIHFAHRQNAQSILAIAKEIAASDLVEFVEANTIMRVDLNATPNDPAFNDLYGMHNTGQESGLLDADIDAPEAWEISTGSRDVVVAIIDTGINAEHPDLKDNVWQNPGEIGVDANGADKKTNGLDDDLNGFVDDWHGWDFVANDNEPQDDNGFNHGSHCAGTIGASGDNGFGVVGVNWQVGLVGIKFLDAAGFGSLENAIKSVEYATNLKVDIMSNSWGGGGFSEILYQAIEAAKKADILFVAAAGNNGLDADEYLHFPSSYDNDNIIAVAATDRNDRLADFSNFGLKHVDLTAPGVDIVSVADKSELRKLSGTSMATPHVAGAAALIKAVYPTSTFADIKNRLLSGVDRRSEFNLKIKSSGRLNIANSLEKDAIPPGRLKNLTFVSADRTSATFFWQPTGDDEYEGTAANYELRYLDRPIVTEDDWEKASRSINNIVIGFLPNGISGSINDLMFNFSGFISVRAYDNVGNRSPLSESLPFSVKAVNSLYENKGTTIADVSVTGGWDIEMVRSDDGFAFSDSPGKWYDDAHEAILSMGPIDAAQANISLAYYTKVDLEKGYDFGYAEISLDNGTTWKQVDLVTGTKEWHRRVIDLSPHLVGQSNTTMQLRFRLKTDFVIRADGWWIDTIMVISD